VIFHFAINLNLLSLRLKATEISERAEQIQKNPAKLSTVFEEVDGSWNTLYGHIKNAYTKADEVNQKYNRLKTTFEQITEKEQ